MQNKTEKNKRSSVVKKIADINKRVMAVFLAAVLSLGAAIPTMVANAPEAEAAETASYSSYIQFTGDRVDSYVFSAGGSASGAIGTCCDPENSVSTGTAGVIE